MHAFLRIKFIIPILTFLVSLEMHSQSMFSQYEEALSLSSLRSIENKGQWDKQVAYRIDLNCGQMYLEKAGFAYHILSDESILALGNHKYHGHTNNSGKENKQTIDHHGLKVLFKNANPEPKIKGLYPHETNYNYFLGKKEHWASEVSAYKAIRYKELYQGTDLFVYEKNGNLKYDFLIRPGNTPQDILIQYIGAESIELNNGNVRLQTSLNTITEQKPVAYQFIDDKRITVPCNFVLNEQNEISFKLPEGYDKNHPLWIDPELIFSTYSGSTGDNWGFTATYDQYGNAYSGGIAVNSSGSYSGYPTTFGAYQTVFQGGARDVAISKYSSDGKRLYTQLI